MSFTKLEKKRKYYLVGNNFENSRIILKIMRFVKLAACLHTDVYLELKYALIYSKCQIKQVIEICKQTLLSHHFE